MLGDNCYLDWAHCPTNLKHLMVFIKNLSFLILLLWHPCTCHYSGHKIHEGCKALASKTDVGLAHVWNLLKDCQAGAGMQYHLFDRERQARFSLLRGSLVAASTKLLQATIKQARVQLELPLPNFTGRSHSQYSPCSATRVCEEE
jgi:hypothetical protein